MTSTSTSLRDSRCRSRGRIAAAGSITTGVGPPSDARSPAPIAKAAHGIDNVHSIGTSSSRATPSRCGAAFVSSWRSGRSHVRFCSVLLLTTSRSKRLEQIGNLLLIHRDLGDRRRIPARSQDEQHRAAVGGEHRGECRIGTERGRKFAEIFPAQWIAAAERDVVAGLGSVCSDPCPRRREISEQAASSLQHCAGVTVNPQGLGRAICSEPLGVEGGKFREQPSLAGHFFGREPCGVITSERPTSSVSRRDFDVSAKTMASRSVCNVC